MWELWTKDYKDESEIPNWKPCPNLSKAAWANLGALGEKFMHGILLYLIINLIFDTYFFQLKFIFLTFWEAKLLIKFLYSILANISFFFFLHLNKNMHRIWLHTSSGFHSFLKKTKDNEKSEESKDREK